MASSKDRQRKLARAKLDRQMARRAAALRRKRRIQAGVGATVALALIVLGSVWALGGFDSEPAPQATEVCSWTPLDATTNTNLKDVGNPPTEDVPTAGTRPMTITTNQGDPITVELDLASSPCAGASFAHLASNNFFDNTPCHEITEEGAIRCGDPSGTGEGGPSYSYYNENIPAPADPAATPTASASPGAEPSAEPTPATPPAYPAGTVALIGSPPGSNGSQFLIFFKDFSPAEPGYSIVGRVTAGLDVVEKIGALQTMDNGSGAQIKPATDVLIQSVTVGEVAEPGATPAPPPATDSAASPAPTASGQS
ncbi:peptidylprolyl isomerase [Solwaraspora sp. WMMD1047]|uniref:peptidylprolyl isomerase n=1 Tax=Solwaraspora sp. WMMD1047 TaxID=3016102 RepID=UPI002417465D|nr:peptidylprolyl isomerase [Solwaraspora sp. WMMD1047]MDG4830283.1 peptidylprolyl isomerase [Solwaraspora sp. WMMD1047]